MSKAAYTAKDVEDALKKFGKESKDMKLLKELSTDLAVNEIKNECYGRLSRKLNNDTEKIAGFANLIKTFNKEMVTPFFLANNIDEGDGIVILDAIIASVAMAVAKRAGVAMVDTEEEAKKGVA